MPDMYHTCGAPCSQFFQQLGATQLQGPRNMAHSKAFVLYFYYFPESKLSITPNLCDHPLTHSLITTDHMPALHAYVSRFQFRIKSEFKPQSFNSPAYVIQKIYM